MRPSRDLAREAHRSYDKTRCGGWLAATGNRPVGGTQMASLAKGPRAVVKVAEPMPAYTCDVHPVEES